MELDLRLLTSRLWRHTFGQLNAAHYQLLQTRQPVSGNSSSSLVEHAGVCVADTCTRVRDGSTSLLFTLSVSNVVADAFILLLVWLRRLLIWNRKLLVCLRNCRTSSPSCSTESIMSLKPSPASSCCSRAASLSSRAASRSRVRRRTAARNVAALLGVSSGEVVRSRMPSEIGDRLLSVGAGHNRVQLSKVDLGRFLAVRSSRILLDSRCPRRASVSM